MSNFQSQSPANINAIEWAQANDRARHVCARVFRDGGAPCDALGAHGLSAQCDANDWGKAVELIADSFCTSTAITASKTGTAQAALRRAA